MNFLSNVFGSSQSSLYFHQKSKVDVIEFHSSIEPSILDDILTYSLNQIRKAVKNEDIQLTDSEGNPID